MTKTCYSCLKPLNTGDKNDLLHSSCAKRLFAGKKVSLRLKHNRSDIIEEARQRATRMSLGGVNPKVVMSPKKGELHIVSADGEFLLKPSTEHHPHISENEHLCMNIVRLLNGVLAAKIMLPPLCLVELADGELAYLVKRFDRNNGEKIHLEDMASVFNYPSDNKYHGSYLEIGKAIQKHCRDKGLSTASFLTTVMLSYLIGNNDLHLKNLSILDCQTHYTLSPIYDMVCAASYYPHAQDMALELMPDYLGSLRDHGFYSADDFITLGVELGMERNVVEFLALSLAKQYSNIQALVDRSFLPIDRKHEIRLIIEQQFKKFCNSLTGELHV